MRAMGYGHRVGIVQFIKGEQLSGEELFARATSRKLTFIKWEQAYLGHTRSPIGYRGGRAHLGRSSTDVE